MPLKRETLIIRAIQHQLRDDFLLIMMIISRHRKGFGQYQHTVVSFSYLYYICGLKIHTNRSSYNYGMVIAYQLYINKILANLTSDLSTFAGHPQSQEHVFARAFSIQIAPGDPGDLHQISYRKCDSSCCFPCFHYGYRNVPITSP